MEPTLTKETEPSGELYRFADDGSEQIHTPLDSQAVSVDTTPDGECRSGDGPPGGTT
jgi:hypothetical protein